MSEQPSNSSTTSSTTTRRNFLKSSSAAAGIAAFAASSVHAGGTDETIRVGLVGCGGRGTGAIQNALDADANTKLVAIGDTFADRIELCLGELSHKDYGDRVKVDPEYAFTGFDNYKKVIDACDVVILTTPPHFRPQHFRYAVEQGKHVFIEKPVAVDAPGIHHVLESCRMAKEKNLSIVSGLCWRYDLGVRETMRQILEEKKIGDIVAIESNYNTGTLWHKGNKPEWSQMEYQIRNWLYFPWLSGDHITEQAIHTLDKTAWLLGDIQPTKAMAMGGRQQRVDPKYGNIYDHFTVFYEYPTGQHVYFTCRQQDDTTNRTEDRVLGTKGQAEILKHVVSPNEGKRWRYRGPKPSMYLVEHQELFKSIRESSPINNGHYMCNSTMLAIMGRMAAYSGKTLTWDECFNSQQRLGPDSYEWTDYPTAPVAIPGKYELA
ncbi:MAG: Gfo/Idh/MocA family oxidoreductase [Planctomycetes bacterium]|nr:Gfo/Idh/MocA family oxidoreductase [Planctomycetota bacterium]